MKKNYVTPTSTIIELDCEESFMNPHSGYHDNGNNDGKGNPDKGGWKKNEDDPNSGWSTTADINKTREFLENNFGKEVADKFYYAAINGTLDI